MCWHVYTKASLFFRRAFGRAFEHHFGPRGQEFERSNLQKFKCRGLPRKGGGKGGGGLLKFPVDRRIRS